MTITFGNQPCFVSYHYAILLSLFWKSHLMLIIQWLLVLGTCSNFDYLYIDFTLLTLWKIKCSLRMAAWMFLGLNWETKAMLLHTLLRVCIYLRYITFSFVKWLGFCLQVFVVRFLVGCFVSYFHSSIFNAFAEFSKWFFQIYKMKISLWLDLFYFLPHYCFHCLILRCIII